MDEKIAGFAKPIEEATPAFEFTICTLVTRKGEYAEMLDSFVSSGFTSDNCEFLYADNTQGNQFDAYKAFNLFLRQAKGKYIIVCHQDVLINIDHINNLRSHLNQLDQLDPSWAICGNAGGVAPNHVVYHINYPSHGLTSKGNFPIKVRSLDENFLVIKNEALLKVSTVLKGFHLYATDLCLQAALNGYTAYAIAFTLTHKSRGNKDHSFDQVQRELVTRYRTFFSTRWIQTNSTVFLLTGNWFGKLMSNPLMLFFVRAWNGLKKKLN